MDYRWPPELTDLADEAATWVREATADLFTIDDGWLVGYSDEFTLRLGERGWIGMCWPTSAGGDGRPEVERFVVTEQLLLGGAPMASLSTSGAGSIGWPPTSGCTWTRSREPTPRTR